MYRGIKITGDQRGRKLGFPTINIELSLCDMGKIFSRYSDGGVFLVHLFVLGEKFSGLLHLGERPTFHSKEFRVEIFVFDFEKMLPNGTAIHFDIQQKIRAVEKFDSPEKLVEQITKDAEEGKKLMKGSS
jgi:riboflavin kinase/FMN adenylyltransferase